jgi:hypothetical protein
MKFNKNQMSHCWKKFNFKDKKICSKYMKQSSQKLILMMKKKMRLTLIEDLMKE